MQTKITYKDNQSCPRCNVNSTHPCPNCHRIKAQGEAVIQRNTSALYDSLISLLASYPEDEQNEFI